MNTKTERAIANFQGGFNCAQAVFTAYSEELNFDKEMALNISCGFGGGMGRMQEKCGAVTGAFMALSIYSGMKYPNNIDKKEKSYPLIREFNEQFKLLNKSTQCKEILNCDIQDPEGHKYAVENNLFGTICRKCVIDAISIVDTIIKDK
jgi:C_GCAxxG_C_C family probable redox protein